MEERRKRVPRLKQLESVLKREDMTFLLVQSPQYGTVSKMLPKIRNAIMHSGFRFVRKPLDDLKCSRELDASETLIEYEIKRRKTFLQS